MRLIALSLLVVACSTPAHKAQDGCETPLGFIPEGQSRMGYLHPLEQNQTACVQGPMTCESGEWSGAYIYPTCVRAP